MESIEISKLRGIREGKLENLSQLVILVGPNGCGKSTVLDALLVGTCPNHVVGMQYAISRNAGLASGLRWMAWRGKVGTNATVRVVARNQFRLAKIQIGLNQIVVQVDGESGGIPKGGGVVTWHPDLPELYLHKDETGKWIPEVRFIDSLLRKHSTPLHQLYTENVETGSRSQAQSIISNALDGIQSIEILTEANVPIVHLVFEGYSVPASQCGDGTHALVRLALEMVSRRDGLVLVEEPEVQLHPRAIRQSARVILAAVKHGVQVILSTHSLEMIDALVEQASEDILDKLSLYRLALNEGVLKSSRLTGPEVKFARDKIEDDLR